ncbi:hypothetical protein HpNP145_15530 [Helicobacter pylori]
MRQHGKNHNELIKELLLTKPKKISLRESNLKELERIKRKKNYKLAQIVRLAIVNYPTAKAIGLFLASSLHN